MLFETTPIITSAAFFECKFQYHSEVEVLPRSFNSISFRRCGSVRFMLGEKCYTSEAGCITLMPCNTAYRTAVDEGGDMIVLKFATMGGEGLPFAVRHLAAPERIENLFAEAIKPRNTAVDIFAISYAYRILGELERALIPEERKPPKNMRLAKELIDLNLKNPDFRISEALPTAGISGVHFRSEFRKYWSASPIEYLKSRRIELAKKLLGSGLCTVTDAAMSSGFDSVSYFSSEFKRITGVTPSDYAKKDAT